MTEYQVFWNVALFTACSFVCRVLHSSPGWGSRKQTFEVLIWPWIYFPPSYTTWAQSFPLDKAIFSTSPSSYLDIYWQQDSQILSFFSCALTNLLSNFGWAQSESICIVLLDGHKRNLFFIPSVLTTVLNPIYMYINWP